MFYSCQGFFLAGVVGAGLRFIRAALWVSARRTVPTMGKLATGGTDGTGRLCRPPDRQAAPDPNPDIDSAECESLRAAPVTGAKRTGGGDQAE